MELAVCVPIFIQESYFFRLLEYSPCSQSWSAQIMLEANIFINLVL